jgi:hypothetical protein
VFAGKGKNGILVARCHFCSLFEAYAANAGASPPGKKNVHDKIKPAAARVRRGG